MEDWLETYFAKWNDCDPAASPSTSPTTSCSRTSHKATHRGNPAATRAIAAACAHLPKNALELVTLHSTQTNWYVKWIMTPPGTRGVTVGTLQNGKIDLSRDYWHPPFPT
jgi:hypothetical protein